MKSSLLYLAICFAIATNGFGQIVTNDSLDITYSKTTSLVFPFPIKGVDRGSKEVLAQKAKGVENVLQLKAARRSFPETNVTVITADGNLHHFTVNYSDNPRTLCILKSQRETNERPLLFPDGVNAEQLSNISKRILDKHTRGSIRKDKKFMLRISLKDIYVNQNIILYKVQISNKSNVDYDIDALRFYIRDQQKVKRTATQEIEVYPIFLSGDAETVKGKSRVNVVYALPKFTIPDAKVLEIDLFEKNGGRNLKLKTSNAVILNAKTITEE
ncbi:conjugative transposon protein TraN [Chryseolinea sp. H1M3-3]|uniref:conjugative transposon protein TraN n=1 Tax=Chryseolinea sp. H1M3-3 TaxID=3034144 RepID=UPI0023ED4073|nr:conjugative transposon protein TraN [Chryseolinea sp. H1M3-3]